MAYRKIGDYETVTGVIDGTEVLELATTDSNTRKVSTKRLMKSGITALAIATGTINIDCELGDYFTLALNANVGTMTFSNLPPAGMGRTLSITITQGSGGNTLALPSSFKFISGSDTTVQDAGAAVTKLFIETIDGGATWSCMMKGFA